MSNNKRRRRRKPSRLSFAAIIGIIALILLIPIICLLVGADQADRNVPDYATGYVSEEIVLADGE